MARQRVSLAPLLGVNSRRVADSKLGGTFMRGGYNVTLQDGEWWTRTGEKSLGSGKVRYGSCPWWWVLRVNGDLNIIANPWWAFAIDDSTDAISELYTAAVTENVSFTNGSATATSATTRVVDQMILVGVGATEDVYRVKSRVGTTMTLDRVYEGTTGSESCRFIDPLARNTAGTATAYSAAFSVLGSWQLQGSCVVFEQLVSHTAADLYAASPTLTGGNLHLVITSNIGCPVAIDLSAYLAGSTVGVRRTWFYNTALGASAAVIGSDTLTDSITPRGVFAEVYKGRLFIAGASDPNGKYGTRTFWYSQQGDLGRWHTGIAAQTAAPNFVTRGGEGDAFAEMKTLRDSLVIHRQDSQETIDATQSLSQPFTVRTNQQSIGVRARKQTNLVVSTNNLHFIWTLSGPAVFDGNTVSLICEDARDALRSMGFIGGGANNIVSHVQHDANRRRIYWYQGTISNVTRHQDALPATAAHTTKAGESIKNFCSCFVYDYDNNSYWFEDRPMCLGGGSRGDGSDGTVLHVSRLDGTLVKLTTTTNDGKDADLTDPSGTTTDVNCQVELPWLDFGNRQHKRLAEVELTIRSPNYGQWGYDQGSTGSYWVRCRVYGDMNRGAALADVGSKYDGSATQFLAANDFQQNPTGLITLTPRADAVQFKLVITNALTSSATAAGYIQGPFRISDITAEYAQRESTTPRTTVTSGSISE